MINTTKFADILSKVHLNKAINECVVTCTKGKVYIYAIDMMESVCVQIKTELEDFPECKIGLSNLPVLIKYLNSMADSDISVNINDNRMVVKVDGRSQVSYLLDPIDVIPTYIDDIFSKFPDLIEDELNNYKYSKPIPLAGDTIGDYLKVNSLFNPNSVAIAVDKKGAVTIHSGSETEHLIDVTIGTTKCKKCTIKLYSSNFSAVLATAVQDESPEMFISPEKGAPVIIKVKDTSWLLKPIN